LARISKWQFAVFALFVYKNDIKEKIISWLFSNSCNDFKGMLEEIAIESIKKGGSKNNKKNSKEIKDTKTS